MTDETKKIGLEIIQRCEERIANGKRIMIEAHRENDREGEWMAKASIHENERAIEKIRKELECAR